MASHEGYVYCGVWLDLEHIINVVSQKEYAKIKKELNWLRNAVPKLFASNDKSLLGGPASYPSDPFDSAQNLPYYVQANRIPSHSNLIRHHLTIKNLAISVRTTRFNT